jgi:pimeloyl-ACP methyl ester carboxylesterase
MVQADYRADAAAITLPTLLIYGRAGNATLPTELGRWLQGQIKGSRLVELQASGHSPFWEEPARFNAELAAFVNA